jgi:hypothetical protein
MRRTPPTRPTLLRPLVFVLATVLLAACGGDDKPAPAAAGTPATADAPEKKDGGLFGGLIGGKDEPAETAGPDLGQFQVVAVTLGSALDDEHNVRTPRTVFSPKDTIHAVVQSAGPHPGLTLVAHWTAADGTVVAHTEQPLVATGPTLTTFSVKNAEPWPVGMYQVAVQVQGHTLQSRAFEIAEK